MRLVRSLVAVGALATLALVSGPTPAPQTAFAADIVPIGRLPRECRISCLTGPNGTKYCGIGAGQIGCHHINNSNQCIFVLCPILPPPDPEVEQ